MITLARVAAIAALFALVTSPALACIITEVEPVPVTAAADGTAKITARVEWEHRNCELDEDDVNIDLTGLVLVSSTGWDRESAGVYLNQLVVRLTGSAPGSIRVWRECTKKGVSEGRFTVNPAPAAPSQPATP